MSQEEFLKTHQFFSDQFSRKNTLQYRIVVQDGISVQGEEIAISNKHMGSNKIVQAVFLSKRG